MIYMIFALSWLLPIFLILLLSTKQWVWASAVITHGGPLGFELQTTVHKNKFLFISMLKVLLVLLGPYWSWSALGFNLVSLMDNATLVVAAENIQYNCMNDGSV